MKFRSGKYNGYIKVSAFPLEIFTELAYRLFNNLGSPFFIFSVEMLANAAVYRAAAFFLRPVANAKIAAI